MKNPKKIKDFKVIELKLSDILPSYKLYDYSVKYMKFVITYVSNGKNDVSDIHISGGNDFDKEYNKDTYDKILEKVNEKYPSEKTIDGFVLRSNKNSDNTLNKIEKL